MAQNQIVHNADTRLASKVGGILMRGFFAYLALTPVIICWGVLLIIVFIITLVSFTQASDAVAAIFGVLSDLSTRFPFLERFALGYPAVKDSGVIEINNSNLTAVIFGLYGWVPCPSRCEFNGSGKSRQLRDWRVSYIRMKYPV